MNKIFISKHYWDDDPRVHFSLDSKKTLCHFPVDRNWMSTDEKIDCDECIQIIESCKKIRATSYKKIVIPKKTIEDQYKEFQDIFIQYERFHYLYDRKVSVAVKQYVKMVKSDLKESEKFKESIDILTTDLGKLGKQFKKLLNKGYFLSMVKGNYMYFAKHQEKSERLDRLYQGLTSNLEFLDLYLKSEG